jgi:hypothetical protein
MPCPSHKPYDPMTIIRPHDKPRLWWLFPWSYARTLHTAANALRALCDRQDEVLEMRKDIIADQEREIERLKEIVRYWQIESKTDHARWIRTLEDLDELRKKGGQS